MPIPALRVIQQLTYLPVGAAGSERFQLLTAAFTLQYKVKGLKLGKLLPLPS
jgi:hypothetical protein